MRDVLGAHGWSRGELVRALAVRGALFGAVWWAIAEGRPVGWYFAVAGVAGATALSVALWPPGRWTLPGVARFVPYFVVESVRGGVDVAIRAYRPGRHVRPDFVEHRFASRDPHVRLLFVNTLSLMPGTLATRFEGDTVLVHLLDGESLAAVELPRALEARVSAMTAGER